MLSRIAIEAAYPVMQRLEEKKLQVLPTDDSPLQNLIMALGPAAFTEGPGVAEVLQARSKDDLHHRAKETVVELASASVARVHDMTRNTVLPMIKEVSAAVEAHVNPRRVEAILPYRITMKEIPQIYSNPALAAMVKRFPAPGGNGAYVSRVVAEVTVDRIKELCKTGMAGVDSEIDLTLSLGKDEGYAAIQQVLNGNLALEKAHVDYLPGLLVTAQAIYNEPEPGVNMTMAEYNEHVNRLLIKTAHLIRGAQSRYQIAEKAGTLYTVEGRHVLSNITVYGKAYRALLEKGLTPEALIGNEMAGRRFNQGQLIESKAALEAIYHREMNLRNLKVQAEMAGLVREAIAKVVGDEIRKRDFSVAESETATIKFRDMLKLINEHNCSDVHQLVTSIVCEVFYPGTDSLTFINLINHCGKQANADTDIREITLMATIKYVNQWLIRQMGIAQA